MDKFEFFLFVLIFVFFCFGLWSMFFFVSSLNSKTVSLDSNNVSVPASYLGEGISVSSGSLTENDYFFDRVYWHDSNKMENNFLVFTSSDSNKIIFLNKDLVPEITLYYETFFPLEFAICLDGNWIGEKLYLNSLSKADLDTVTKTSVVFGHCLNGIGLHSHPSLLANNVYCEASDKDFSQSSEFDGLVCGRKTVKEILFYGKERRVSQLFISSNYISGLEVTPLDFNN